VYFRDIVQLGYVVLIKWKKISKIRKEFYIAIIKFRCELLGKTYKKNI